MYFQPVPPLAGGVAPGVGRGRGTGARGGGGREWDPLAVLSDRWETEQVDGGGWSGLDNGGEAEDVKNMNPLAATTPSSRSGWRLSSCSRRLSFYHLAKSHQEDSCQS